MEFWLLAVVITGLVAGGMALAALTRRAGAAPRDQAVQVYRDQLSEVDRDLARGVIGSQEADRLRLEVSRRLLDADRREQGALDLSARPSPILAAVLVAAVFGGAFWLYGQIGSTGLRDLPLKIRLAMAENTRLNRINQSEAEALTHPQPATDADPALLTLIAELREALKTRPNDLAGHELLASNEAGLGDYAAAHRAYRQVIEIKAADALVRDFETYADLLVLAANGYVSPQAEAAVGHLLNMDANSGTGRYYLGLLNTQIGRPDIAFVVWRKLLQDSDANAPWVAPIRAQIEFAAAQAGVRYELPALAPGPTSDDVAAAADMTAEERAAFIRGMVDQLSDRLARDGGSVQEWARLIVALGVLGEIDRAAVILNEAHTVFATSPEALDTLGQAAINAGISQ